MNASELTFGIEIECTVPSDVQIRVGGRHNGVQIRELPAGWNAQSDGSIHAQAGHKGVEVVSGILRGTEGLQQICGLSWTASLDIACWFANRLRLPDPAVYVAQVQAEDVYCFVDDREEQEFIVRPRRRKRLPMTPEQITAHADVCSALKKAKWDAELAGTKAKQLQVTGT